MGLPQRMAWALWGAGLMGLGWPIGAYAQLTPDASLGMSSSTVSTFGTTDIIGGGLQRGTVRLHSFQDFNVAAGRRAFFMGATTILTRVTGSTPSTIDGMLEFNGSGDFFLLNPNGLIFGANAFLKVPGSFVGTTGRGIQIGGDRFSSNLADPLPGVLTIQPSALWLNGPMGPIVNRSTIFGAGLFPGTGHRAILAGGAIQFDSGGKLTGNYVQVAGLGGTGFVPLISDGNPKLDLDSARNQGLVQGRIDLLNDARIWSFNAQNGAVEVAAQTLNLNNGGIQIFGQAPASGTLGPIQIQADTIALNNGSIIQAIAQPGTTINLGTIDITGRTLTVGVGSSISTAQLGTGSGGLVRLNLSDRIRLDSQIQAANAYVGTSGSATSIGNSGTIEITTPELQVLNGAVISNTQSGQGSAGEITIRAQTVTVSGRGPLATQPSLIGSDYRGSGGQAGRVTIQAQSLNLLDGGGISAGGGPANGGTGNGGQITLDVSGGLVMAGPRTSFISAQTAGPATSNGGRINLRAGSVDLQANAGISVDGNQGGTLGITSGRVTIDQSSNLSAQGRVQGGQINLTGSQISLANNSSINAGGPQAGRVQIQAQEVSLANRGYIGAEGNGGSIGIQAQSVRLDDSGIATNGTIAGGQSGTIAIAAPRLLLNDSTLSTVNWRSGGLGGRIDLKTSDLAVQNVSAIDVSGQGQSGSIQVGTTTLAVTQDSNLWANSAGQGGQIDVIAQGQITLAAGGNLVANGDIGGQITIQSTGLSLGGTSGITAMGNSAAGGTIAIQSGPVTLQNSQIKVLSTQGSGGTLTIDSSALSLATGSSLNANGVNGGRIAVGPVTGLDSSITANGTANGGTLEIAGPGSFIRSELRAMGRSGQGGQILVQDAMTLSNTAIDSSGQSGGQIQIAGPLSLAASALISSGSAGAGGRMVTQSSTDLQGSSLIANGTIGGQIQVTGPLRLRQSQLLAQGTSGSGGSIISPAATTLIESAIDVTGQSGGQLQLAGPTSLSQSQLIAQGRSGSGGQILIQTPGKLNLAGSSIEASGVSGGQISLVADRLNLIQGSQIHAKGSTSGGSIRLTAPLITAFDNSDMTTVSLNGGGRIDVQSKAIVGTAFRRALTPDSDIIANWDGSGITSTGAIAGNISGVDNPESIVRDRAIDASRNSEGLQDNADQIRIACQGIDESNGDANEFYITGGRLLQPSPDRPLVTPLKAWSSQPNPARSIAEFAPAAPNRRDQQPEAQAWYRDDRGRIVLGAVGSNSAGPGVVSGCLARGIGP